MQISRTSTFLRSMLPLLLTVSAATALADEHASDGVLVSGDWTGFFKPSGADETDLEVDVAVDSENPSDVQITIQMDMDPRDRFRFRAEDVEVDGGTISFRFGRTADMRSCELDLQNNGEYVGRCIADDADEGTPPSAISIEPPQKEEADVGDEESNE